MYINKSFSLMHKMICILIYSCFFIGLFFCSFYIVNANYIDPSVMTYAIQAIAGLVIAAGAFFGVYWRNVKRILSIKNDLFEYETDELYFDDQNAKTIVYSYRAKNDSKSRLVNTQISFHGVLFSFSFLICIVVPLQLYFMNVDEFAYDFFLVIKYLVILFPIVFFVGFFIFSNIKRFPKLFYILLSLVYIMFFDFYIQSTFMTGSLPRTDGSAIDWSLYKSQEIQSFIVLIIIIIVFVFGFLKYKRRIFLYCSLISKFITFSLIIMVIITGINNNGFKMKKYLRSTNLDLNILSSNKNLIILVLDAVDSSEFKYLLNTCNGKYEAILQDFTYYPDTLAGYPYTKYSIPLILTGEWYSGNSSFELFYTKALAEAPIIKYAHKNNCLISVYDESDIIISENEKSLFSNIRWHRFHEFKEPVKFVLDELRASFYLCVPFQLKKYEPMALYNLTDEDEDKTDDVFVWDNKTFFDNICNLEAEYTNKERIIFIHLQGAHAPLIYDSELNQISTSEATYTMAVEASLKIVEEYISFLKRSDAYDNSAIIILSDHGNDDGHNKENCFLRQNPLFLVKGLNEDHTFSTSDAQISYDDLQKTYLSSLAGRGTFVRDNQERKFLYYNFNEDNQFIEYVIDGEGAFDSHNMQLK